MEVMITGDRRAPETDIAPFPEPITDSVAYYASSCYTSPTAVVARPHIPPMKLRPIRCNAGEISGTVGKEKEVGLFCGVNAESSEYFEHHVKADGDDVAGIGGGGARETVVSGQGNIGSGSDSGVGVENGGRNSLDDEFSLSSDDDDSSVAFKEPANRKRKRESSKKIKLFLEGLVMRVMEKQEQMHKQLIEMIEKNEKERIGKEEAWKRQEMERWKRDEELRAQEAARSMDLISLIQKVLGNEIEVTKPSMISSGEGDGRKALIRKASTCNHNNRRWPDAEAQALIMLRTSLEHKFREVGSKCSIWDEISVGMHNLGYNRTARKCKEKWENMNKYFKRAMEKGKKPHDNGKTCSYFNELGSLYRNGLVNSGNILNYTNNEIVATISGGEILDNNYL